MTLERIRSLSAAGTVTVAHLDTDSAPPRHTPAVAAERVVSAGRLRRRTPAALVASYVAGVPLSVWRNADEAYVGMVGTLDGPWDVIYVDHWLVWEAARTLRGGRKVLHLHNAEPVLFERAATTLSGPRRWAATLEARRAARYLRAIMCDVDELHLLSPSDQSVLARMGIRHPTTRVFLPAVADSGAASGGFAEREARALFVGSLSWFPNDEGLRWFLASVWPRCRSVRELEVAGGGASPRLRALALRAMGVTLSGYVEELEPRYERTRCLVAPLLSGSGIKMKIVNALARGIPVVTTPVGAEGMPSGTTGMFVTDDAAEFANHIDHLTTNEHCWSTASRAGRAYAARHFSGAAFSGWCAELAHAEREHAQ